MKMVFILRTRRGFVKQVWMLNVMNPMWMEIWKFWCIVFVGWFVTALWHKFNMWFATASDTCITAFLLFTTYHFLERFEIFCQHFAAAISKWKYKQQQSINHHRSAFNSRKEELYWYKWTQSQKNERKFKKLFMLIGHNDVSYQVLLYLSYFWLFCSVMRPPVLKLFHFRIWLS